MTKKRVYELAKELNVENKVVIETLNDMGFSIKNHMSGVDDDICDRVTTKLSVKNKSGDSKKVSENTNKVEKTAESRVSGDEKEVTRGVTKELAKKEADKEEGKKAESNQEKPAASQSGEVSSEASSSSSASDTGTQNKSVQPQGSQGQNVKIYRPNQGSQGSYSTGYNKRREGGQSPSGQGSQQGQRRDNTQGGYQGQRRDGAQATQQGQRREGGYQGQRRDGAQGTQGGYQGQRRDGAQGSQGGYQGQRRDGAQGSQGGYQGQRRDGAQGSQGGYQGQRRDGGQGSQQGQRRDGAQGSQQGQRREGGYQGQRRDGAQGTQGGYQGQRRDGAQGQGGYQGQRRDGAQGSQGGYQGQRRDGGASTQKRGEKLSIPDAPALDTKISRQTHPGLKKDDNFKREKTYDSKPKKNLKKSQGIDYDKPLPALVNDLMVDENGEWILETAENIKVKPKKPKKEKNTANHSASGKDSRRTANDPIPVPEHLMVSELATLINKNPNEIIVKLMQLGTMATINQEVEYEIAELIASDFGITTQLEIPAEVQEIIDLDAPDNPEDMTNRAPIVTVMGHVDHGKTSLLDAIRNTNVIGGEAGGITQHIGASEVYIKDKKIVLLDTPGHEAFTSLRARGAKITDIAILVVAADDGVMPQTIEAIDHAKAAGVPIIVAINKIDKEAANPERVIKELADNGLLVEDWGGDTVCVQVSAKKGINIEGLLEMVLLVADLQELKANPNRPGRGTVIESRLDKGKGPVATILVDSGTLSVGDPVVAGFTCGRVRAMFNFQGKRVKKVGPSTSVEITGLEDVPQAGDRFYVTRDDKQAKDMADRQKVKTREEGLRDTKHVSLEDLFTQIKAGSIKDLNLIIKADAHGSIEAMKGSLLKLSNEEVRVNIIHATIGAITESDVMLASASNAIIIGFNVRPQSSVALTADREGVEIKTYRIIYEAINDVEAAMTGMLDPEFKEVVIGTAEVRDTFKVPNIGVIAGTYIKEGKMLRAANVRIVRDGIIIHDGKISSLKRFKDDVKEVATGYECGIGIEKFNDIKVGDEIEGYIMEEIKRV